MLNTKGGGWETAEEEITMNHEGQKKTSANLRKKTVLSLINIY